MKMSVIEVFKRARLVRESTLCDQNQCVINSNGSVLWARYIENPSRLVLSIVLNGLIFFSV